MRIPRVRLQGRGLHAGNPSRAHSQTQDRSRERGRQGGGMQQLTAAAGLPGISLAFSFFQTLNNQFSPPFWGFLLLGFHFLSYPVPPSCRSNASLHCLSSHSHSRLPDRQQGVSTSFSLHCTPSYSHSPLHCGKLSLVRWVLGPCFLSMDHCHRFGSVNLGEWSLKMRQTKVARNCQL